MSTKTKGPAAERFREAKRQFERWRQGRRRPGRIPTGLWLLAAEAAEELGIEEAARQVLVPAERLEEWVAQHKAGDDADGAGRGRGTDT